MKVQPTTSCLDDRKKHVVFCNSNNSRSSLPLKITRPKVFFSQILTASLAEVMGPLGNGRGVDGVMGDDGTGGSCINSSSFKSRTESWVTDLKQNGS